MPRPAIPPAVACHPPDNPPISGERKGKPDRRRSPSVHASHGNQEPQKGGVSARIQHQGPAEQVVQEMGKEQNGPAARREPRPSREPSSRDRSAQHISTPSTYRASKATSARFMSSPSPKGAAGIGRTTRPASPSAAARRNENRMATHGAPGTCRTCPRPRGTGTCRISGTSAWPVPGPVSGIGRTTRPRDGSSASRIPGSGADPPSDGTGRTTCRRHGPGAYGISDRSPPARSGGVSRRRA